MRQLKHTVIIITFLLSISTFGQLNQDSNSIELNKFFGVWANETTEYIRTKSFSILFEKVENEIFSVLKTMEVINDTLYYQTLSIVRFKCETKEVEHEIFPQNTIVAFPLNNRPVNNIESLKSSNILRLKTLNGVQELERNEKIEIVQPYNMTKALRDNIGLCLQEWNLGSKGFINMNSKQISIQINTNYHSYSFSVLPQFIYCRAAKIKSNNNGTLFAQNIRLMKKPKEFTCQMNENNLNVINTELEIDNSLFNPNVCVFAENGIYWSLIDSSKDTIKVNGCGEEYLYTRPQIENNKLFEFIKLKE